ncbi:MAG: glycosyltransferase [Syntrophorhabdaceae bacterium]|nr:glycosyltransferase [Syntrophorhabdaceae bacterium]MDD4195614.1 glycosyltransferase [Syntrophorhabdaceae bacterium]
MMLVSVIIINWNKPHETCAAIESVIVQDYMNIEIIVVDNASQDKSIAIITNRYPDVRLIPLKRNLGCPGGRNMGAAEAHGELLFFLDDDGFYVEGNLISKIVSLFHDKPKMGAAYFKLTDFHTKMTLAPLNRSVEYIDKFFLSSSFRGGASVIRSALFRDVGQYPFDFFRQMEERFLSLKIYNAGYYVAYVPQLTMCHKGSSYVNKNRIIAKYQMANEIKTIIQLYPTRYLTLYLIGKLLVHLKQTFENGAIFDYVMTLCKIPVWLLIRRKKSEIVSCEVFKTVEGLKHYDAFSPEDLKDVMSSYSTSDVFFRS